MNSSSADHNVVMTIDKDRYDFFIFAYFGGEKNPYLASSRRAYLDLCRTLRLHGENGQEYRKSIDELLEARISPLISNPKSTQEEYDGWHHTSCNDIVQFYRKKEITFNLGHAQKWINMTMKYLYLHGGVDMTELLCFLHVPLDQYVFAAVEKYLAISRPCNAWSKITDYDAYLGYQKKIREKVDGAPLRWEFRHWMDEAMFMTEKGCK